MAKAVSKFWAAAGVNQLTFNAHNGQKLPDNFDEILFAKAKF